MTFIALCEGKGMKNMRNGNEIVINKNKQAINRVINNLSTTYWVKYISFRR